MIVYGIRNCDTVQRARKRLDEAEIAYRFHDFKTEGLSLELARSWVEALGVDVIVNRKGTTWRKLDEATRVGLTPANAPALLAREPSLVKRPVMVYAGGFQVGFPKADESVILERLRSR